MTSAPRPGSPVRGSRTGRPVMALFDLVGRRWCLRIIWELHEAEQPLTFRQLRRACDEVSSSVLTRRLHELADALITAHTGEGYALTAQGRSLVGSLRPVLRWSEHWSQALVDAKPIDDAS